MRIRTSCFSLFVCLIVSCGSDHDFLDGYDRNALFAAPTPQEIAAVTDDWSNRDLSPDDYTVEQTTPVTENGSVLKILSFRVNGVKEYAALLVPRADAPMPVRMFIGGFGKDITQNTIILNFDDSSFDHPFIFAIPALRGQSLSVTLNGVNYVTPLSEGRHCDAFDGATDDAIALLNVIGETESMADVNRVSVRGGSRGGTVALLMAERDKRVKIAIDVAGPTDMLGLTSKNENDLTYQCQFLEALVNKTSTVEETRHQLIASSPIFFAKDLPRTQVHLAERDQIVPVSQGEELNAKIEALGMTGSFEMFIYPDKDHTNIATENAELEDRIAQLLSQL